MGNEVEALYETIANHVAAVAPTGWASIRVDAKLLDDYRTVDFFYTNQAGLEAPFDSGLTVFRAVSGAFIEVRKLMSAAGDAPWFVAQFSLQASGKFHIDFSYEHPGDIFAS